MIRKLVLLVILPFAGYLAKAQITPQGGDFTIAASVSYNSFTTVEAQVGTLSEYGVVAPSTNWADKKLMTGIEFGIFASPSFKISLGGGVNYSKNPGYNGVPGTSGSSFGEIPTYRAVDESTTFCYDGHLAFDLYINTSAEQVKLITGLRGGFAYCIDEKRFQNPDAIGKSLAEAYTMKGSIDFGAEYFLGHGFYVGALVDFASYTYGIVSHKPQEGLGSLKADNHNFSFLSAPTIKVGFKF